VRNKGNEQEGGNATSTLKIIKNAHRSSSSSGSKQTGADITKNNPLPALYQYKKRSTSAIFLSSYFANCGNISDDTMHNPEIPRITTVLAEVIGVYVD